MPSQTFLDLEIVCTAFCAFLSQEIPNHTRCITLPLLHVVGQLAHFCFSRLLLPSAQKRFFFLLWFLTLSFFSRTLSGRHVGQEMSRPFSHSDIRAQSACTGQGFNSDHERQTLLVDSLYGSSTCAHKRLKIMRCHHNLHHQYRSVTPSKTLSASSAGS